MNLVEKRDYIHNHISKADEKFLDDVFKKLQKVIQEKETIVGSRPDGEPISKYDLVKRAKEAEEEIALGKYVSQEELEGEIENW